MRTRYVIGLIAALGAAATVVTIESDASACGGCFHPPNENPSAITDHRMILSVSAQQTTLYDQIHYTGSPSSFAWVLPIAGQVTVGLSSDALFTALDNATTTTILAPEPNCPPPPCPFPTAGGVADAGAFGDAGVVVTHHEVVGPYDTVQLHSSDPNALSAWLTQNGYAIPADVQSIISAYVNDGFDFLALKLVPGAGVQAMRPVRVTSKGASAKLPLRLVAAGTGATVGVTLWVVAEGRYEPQNFPTFRIDDADIVWDFNQNISNYRALRATKSAALNGTGWELESSLSQYEDAIRQSVTYASQPGFGPDAGVEYPPVLGADGGVTETGDQAMKDDLDTLFAGIPGPQLRVTRLRADLSRAALANDLALVATLDQSEATNLRRPAKTSGTPVCPTYPPCAADGDGGFVPFDAAGPGTSPGAVSGSGGAFSCATSPGDLDGITALLGLAAAVGVGFGRARRKR